MGALFALHYRVNREYINKLGWFKEDVSYVQEVPSLSDDLLLKAQNNVISQENYAKEMIGFRGIHGEEVYGSQGTNQVMPGYNANSLFDSVANFE